MIGPMWISVSTLGGGRSDLERLLIGRDSQQSVQFDAMTHFRTMKSCQCVKLTEERKQLRQKCFG